MNTKIHCKVLGLLLAGCASFLAPHLKADPESPNRPSLTVDLGSFEKGTDSWVYNAGAEFHGARGRLTHDPYEAAEGQGSLRLEADFFAGGQYVAAERDIPENTVETLVFWVKCPEARTITVRLKDSGGQVHQFDGLPLRHGGVFERLVVNTREASGREHWGGANDGIFHPPLKGLAIVLDRAGLKNGAKAAVLWLDGLQGEAHSEEPARLQLQPMAYAAIFTEGSAAAFALRATGLAGEVEYAVLDGCGRERARGRVKPDAPSLTLAVLPCGWYQLRLAVAGNALAAQPFAVLPRSAGPGAGSLAFGVCTHFGQGWDPALIPLVVQAGAGAVRDEIYWSAVEPARGKFEIPAVFERYMADLRQNGIAPLIILSYGNPHHGNGDAPHDPETRAAFAAYAAQVLKHFGKDIKDVEVWNEWNYAPFCKGPAASRPEVYRDLLRDTAKALKADREDLRVIGGAVMGLELGDGVGWLDRLLALENAGASMDGVSVHPYHWQFAPEYLEPETRRLREILARNGFKKPFWFSEIGWPDNTLTGFDADAGPRLRSNELEQAAYLVRAHALGFEAGARRIFWYDFMDDGVDPENIEHHLGLLYSTASPFALSPKPAFAAYATMTRALSAAVFQKREDLGADLRCLLFRIGDADMRVLWPTVAGGVVDADLEGPAVLIGLLGDETRLAAGRALLPLATPCYLSGKVRSLKAALAFKMAATIEAATGEKPALAYELRNLTHTDIKGRLALRGGPGLEVAIPANACSRGSLNLDAESRERSFWSEASFELPEGIALYRPVSIRVRRPLQPASKLHLQNGNLRVLLRNSAAGRALSVREIAWESEGSHGSGKTELRLPPLSTQILETALDPIPAPYQQRYYRVTLKGEEANTGAFLAGFASDNPVPRLAVRVDGDLGEWRELDAIDFLKSGSVRVPDHKGADDLGAEVRVAWDEKHFHLCARVRDDVHSQPFAGADIWQGDSLQLAIKDGTPWEPGEICEIGLALVKDQPCVHVWRAPAGRATGPATGAEIAVARGAGETIYEASFPLDRYPFFRPRSGAVFSLSMLVNDNDGAGRRGWIEWGSGIAEGKDPALFQPCYLVQGAAKPAPKP